MNKYNFNFSKMETDTKLKFSAYTNIFNFLEEYYRYQVENSRVYLTFNRLSNNVSLVYVA